MLIRGYFSYTSLYSIVSCASLLSSDTPPRNIQQVQNARKVASRLMKIDADLLDAIITVAGALPDFVQATNFVTRIGDYNVVLFNEAAMVIGQSSSHASVSKWQVLSYDTTFNIGDIYVSPLLCRLTTIEGHPVFPLAFFLHYRKLQSSHSFFFNFLRNHKGCQWLDGQKMVQVRFYP